MTVDQSLTGRVAIVTGGGGGIGSATAQRLALLGALVVVADLEASPAETAAEAISSAGGEAVAATVDIGDESSVEALIATTLRVYGRLDMLVNNASRTDRVALEGDVDLTQIDTALWDSVMQVNLRGTMLCCKHALPHMLSQGRGAIVNIGSIDGVRGRTARAAYGSSKAGVLLLTKSIAAQYGRRGIRCNSIIPGLILTPAVERNLDDAQLAAVGENYLTPRLGTPADVAAAVAYLLSDDAGFVTGAALHVDGGATAHLPFPLGV